MRLGRPDVEDWIKANKGRSGLSPIVNLLRCVGLITTPGGRMFTGRGLTPLERFHRCPRILPSVMVVDVFTQYDEYTGMHEITAKGNAGEATIQLPRDIESGVLLVELLALCEA